jgi:predicted phosphate transport protein (TIGR00153 family)
VRGGTWLPWVRRRAPGRARAGCARNSRFGRSRQAGKSRGRRIRDARGTAAQPALSGEAPVVECDNPHSTGNEDADTMPSLMPREGKFFEFFNQHAQLASAAAIELQALLSDLSQMELRTRAIERNEKQADRITHETVQLLHKTFITPLDRDEIHQLITGMDDILDLMEDVATCLFLYDVKAVTADAQKLAQICVTCTDKVREAVRMLESMKNADRIMLLCGEIDRLESEADFVFRSALAKLFREESDVKQIIKLKEVYQLLESITDKCEDVANVIEGIVLENA